MLPANAIKVIPIICIDQINDLLSDSRDKRFRKNVGARIKNMALKPKTNDPTLRVLPIPNTP